MGHLAVRELGLATMESVGFQGVVGAAGMPADVEARLATEFAAFVKADNERWARLIEERKLQLD